MRIRFALLASLLLAGPVVAAGLDVPEGGYVVSDDLSLLPEPVRAKYEALLAAAESGEMEQLAALMDAEGTPVTVSFGDPDDPIAYLKQQSADGEGRESLARLAELLEMPYAAFDSGDGDILYAWPYLARLESLAELTPAQQVDAIRLLGYDGFKQLGQMDAWYFWRAGIGAHGQWQYFVAGD